MTTFLGLPMRTQQKFDPDTGKPTEIQHEYGLCYRGLHVNVHEQIGGKPSYACVEYTSEIDHSQHRVTVIERISFDELEARMLSKLRTWAPHLLAFVESEAKKSAPAAA